MFRGLKGCFASFWHDATRKIDFATLDKVEEADHTHQMHRNLTFSLLLFMVIANVVGAGIFVTPGTAAAQLAGPSVVLSFALAGFVAICAALCYAEMAGRVRGSGSAVSYAYGTIGELLAFLIGCDLLLEITIGSAAVASGWSDNLSTLLHTLFGFEMPHVWFGLHINFPAAAIVLVITGVLMFGVNHTAKATLWMSILKLTALAVFVCIAGWHFNPSNLHPFYHPQHGPWGTCLAAARVFFAFVGFESITAAAAECKNPQRDLPRAIVWGVGICTALYMVTSLVLVAAVHYSNLDGNEAAAPLAKALALLGCKWGTLFVSIGSLISLTSVLLVSIYGLTRIMRSLSRFGLLPEFFGTLTKTTKVPKWTTPISGVAIALAAATLAIAELAELCNIGTLAAFAIVSAAVMLIRIKTPNEKSTFMVPLFPLIPIAGVVTCIAMMFFLPWLSWIRLFGCMSIALTWYTFKGRFNSRLTEVHASKGDGNNKNNGGKE